MHFVSQSLKFAFRSALVLLFALNSVSNAQEKSEAPEHNVVLVEEEEVNRLLVRAERARERAEQGDPEAWPICIKAYSDILSKYPNTVYLDRWKGDNKNKENDRSSAYGLGVYRPTSDRVRELIASLPPAGLAVYRAVNDPEARKLLADAEASFDLRKLDEVAQIYFSTSFGDDALFQLARHAFGNGDYRLCLGYLNQLSKHPDPSIPHATQLAYKFRAQRALGQTELAHVSLEELGKLVAAGDTNAFRIGHFNGTAALDFLKSHLEQSPITKPVASKNELSWETIGGNAAQNKILPTLSGIGMKKWSLPILELLGAPAGYELRDNLQVRIMRGGTVGVALRNYYLVARDGYFFLADNRGVVCHPANNPNPEMPKFRYPPEYVPPEISVKDNNRSRTQYGMFGIYMQPQFATLGGDHLFMAMGPEPMPNISQRFGGDQRVMQKPNWLVAVGKRRGGTQGVESGSLLWTLEPGSDPEFRINSKENQEWLKSKYFACSPTYEDGTLYAPALSTSGSTRELWVAAFDAMSGRLLWKTMLCSNQPISFGGPIQPALCLPLAVSRGVVCCVTNLGAVATLEAATGKIRWIRIYDRVKTSPNNWGGEGLMATGDFWADNPPMIVNEMVIAAPQDSDQLYAFELASGKRKWELIRASDPNLGTVSGDMDRLKYILGIANGFLVLSGKNVLFIDIETGRRASQATTDRLDILGRGVAATNVVLVPTDKGIVKINSALSNGIPIAKLMELIPWPEDPVVRPEQQAGHLIVAEDVLYSVSVSYVSAFFNWQQLESKLLNKIAEEPQNLKWYLELGDGYRNAKTFDEAIKAYDLGLAQAGSSGLSEEKSKSIEHLRKAKFRALVEKGQHLKTTDQPDWAMIEQTFEQAVKSALTPVELVEAHWRLAETALSSKKPELAVEHYQRMRSNWGDTPFEFKEEGPQDEGRKGVILKASIHATTRIDAIGVENKQALEKLNRIAQEELQSALQNKDTEKLERFVASFPNTTAYGPGLIALADRLADNGQHAKAKNFYLRYKYSYPESEQLALVSARLALAYERSGNLAAARNTLQNLERDSKLGSVEIELDARKLIASEWARSRLASETYQRTITRARYDLGEGKPTKVWTKSVPADAIVLDPVGQAPPEHRSDIFLIEDKRLSARSGQTGDLLWNQPAELPENFAPDQPFQICWSGSSLIVSGQQHLVAYNTANEGQIVWRYALNPNSETGGGAIRSAQPIDHNLVIDQVGGLLTLLDTQSGQEVWRRNLAMGQMNVVTGENFLALTFGKDPGVIRILDLASGNTWFEFKLQVGNIQLGPVAVGEQLYIVSSDNVLRAYNVPLGRQIWEQSFNTSVVGLEANYDMVVTVLSNLEMVACRPDGSDDNRIYWRSLSDDQKPFAGMIVDGDHTYRAWLDQKGKGVISAFKSRGGKFEWDKDFGGTPTRRFARLDIDFDLAVNQLMITLPSFIGSDGVMVALVDRVTGKLTWYEEVSTRTNFFATLIQGGMVIKDGTRITGYLALGPEKAGEILDGLKRKYETNPRDHKVALHYAMLLEQKGALHTAAEILAKLIEEGASNDEAFHEVFQRYSSLRATLSLTKKETIAFTRINTPPTIDGDLKDWAEVPAIKLDSWNSVYLAGEIDQRNPMRRQDWRGPQDLSLEYRASYDERNLYLAVSVQDDLHKNEQTSGPNLWNGDSLQVAFDLERDTGIGFFGKDFLLGFALSNTGKIATTTVKSGRYSHKPYEHAYAVKRDDANKTTVYEIAFPLSFLTLSTAKGTKFGFTFIVNDLDRTTNVEKSMAPAPGILTNMPGQYAIGELQ